MLLLREDAGFDPEGLARHDPGALVREYAAWARAGARETVLGGERLEDEGRIVRAGGERLIVEPLGRLAGAAGGRIGGYFLIRAEDLEEAVRLAGSCPHLTHGGSIEVREIGR